MQVVRDDRAVGDVNDFRFHSMQPQIKEWHFVDKTLELQQSSYQLNLAHSLPVVDSVVDDMPHIDYYKKLSMLLHTLFKFNYMFYI